MLYRLSSMINQFLDFLNHYTDGMVGRYGFYIPTDPYRFIFWSDVIIAILLLFLFYYWLRCRSLKRRVSDREGSDRVTEIQEIKEYNSEEIFDEAIRAEYVPIKDSDDEIWTKQILLAIMEGKSVFMEYVKYDGTRSSRWVKPYRLYSYQGSEYMEGFCFLRNAERNFKLSRIRSLEIELSNGESADAV